MCAVQLSTPTALFIVINDRNPSQYTLRRVNGYSRESEVEYSVLHQTSRWVRHSTVCVPASYVQLIACMQAWRIFQMPRHGTKMTRITGIEMREEKLKRRQHAAADAEFLINKGYHTRRLTNKQVFYTHYAKTIDECGPTVTDKCLEVVFLYTLYTIYSDMRTTKTYSLSTYLFIHS
jgi:hypothetical protein